MLWEEQHQHFGHFLITLLGPIYSEGSLVFSQQDCTWMKRNHDTPQIPLCWVFCRVFAFLCSGGQPYFPGKDRNGSSWRHSCEGACHITLKRPLCICPSTNCTGSKPSLTGGQRPSLPGFHVWSQYAVQLHR